MRAHAYDCLIQDRRVLCGGCALNRSGLGGFNSNHIDMMTTEVDFDGFSMAYLTMFYYNPVDYENWVRPSPANPNILIPTKERALIDYMRNEKWCDEGLLIDALKDYLLFFRNDEELYRVADFYGVKREILDYWINEALMDEEV